MTVRVLTPAREEFSEAAAFYESEAGGYEIHPDHLLVVAVAHQRKLPGYWRDRLK